MRPTSTRPRVTVVLLLSLLALSRAAGQEPPTAASNAQEDDAADDAAGSAAILSAMASRAQQNSLSQTLIAFMALAAAELEEPPLLTQGESGNVSASAAAPSSSSSSPSSPPLLQAATVVAAPTSDINATTTPVISSTSAEQDPALFRNLLRDHIDELVARQQGQFANALSFGDKDDGGKGDADDEQGQFANALSFGDAGGNDDGKDGFKNNIAGGADFEKRRDALGTLLAKVAERAVTSGTASINLYDQLMGLGSIARAATSSQIGAGPCGRYGWDAGGEFAPAVWQGPILSLSLSLGSCALVPSLEGPGAALTAGSAWTNAVGELACLGPGLAYALSPLSYTSAGLSGEALTVPACRLAASFGPSASLTLTRSPRTPGAGGGGGNGGKKEDVYPSEGAFLAAAVLNATLDRRIRALERGLALAAGLKGGLPMWRKGGEVADEASDEEAGGDYEFSWAPAENKGSDALRVGTTGRHLAGELLRHVAWGDKKGFVKAAAAEAAGDDPAAGAAAEAKDSSPAFQNQIG